MVLHPDFSAQYIRRNQSIADGRKSLDYPMNFKIQLVIRDICKFDLQIDTDKKPEQN